MKPKPIEFLHELYRIWITERPTILAAGLAYYSLFSLVPLIYVTVAIAGIFIDKLAMIQRLSTRVSEILGPEVAQAFREAVLSLMETFSRGSFITSLISFLALFFAASFIFFQLKFALDTIWKVPPPQRDETRNFIKQRLFAFILVFGVAMLLVASALVSLILSVLSTWLNLASVNYLSTLSFFILATISFALVYQHLPSVTLKFRDVWLGALVASLSMFVAVSVLGWYLRRSSIGSAFEAAGTVAVILITIYALADIFLFGAVFTKVYARMYGSMAAGRPHDEMAEMEGK